MKDGFVKVSAVTPAIKTGDVEYNAAQIIDCMNKEYKKHTKIALFPSLCLTGSTCGDLFLQKALLEEAESGIVKIAEASKGHDTLCFIGFPFEENGEVHEAVAAIQDGEILTVLTDEYNDVVFKCVQMEDLVVGVDIGDGVSDEATLILQPVAEPELVDSDERVTISMAQDSHAQIAAIIRANAGEGESTTDNVYAGVDVIAEDGRILAKSSAFSTGALTTDIDVQRINIERAKNGYPVIEDDETEIIDFSLKIENTKLVRSISSTPFIPEKTEYLEKILDIQTAGLVGRMKAIGSRNAVIGISGGLDSTCALIVCAKAFDLMGISRKNIHAITMPCFGTSDITYKNACALIKSFGCTFSEINIKDAVTLHLKDIGHKLSDRNVTYENAQARERTQVLMDIANDENAIVIGTGDLSELALGWCTYNGDHMSNYAVNASVPKTLMRHLVRYYADNCGDKKLCRLLIDVINTPVSPELLPPEKGKISQKTEEKIGPYELHDFFLYYFVRCGFKPSKIFRLAKYAWGRIYSDKQIYACLEIFINRFFNSQFKRSCMPDGPKVGTVDLSPRGDWDMPSDAAKDLWIKELRNNVKLTKKAD